MLASVGGEVGAGRFLCHFDPRFWKLEARGWRLDTPHPRVFWEKSAQSIENKGWEVEKERQESSRVRKRLEGKEIEEVEEVKEFTRGALLGWGAGETNARQEFTTYDRTDYRTCQYINGFLVFRDSPPT